MQLQLLAHQQMRDLAMPAKVDVDVLVPADLHNMKASKAPGSRNRRRPRLVVLQRRPDLGGRIVALVVAAKMAWIIAAVSVASASWSNWRTILSAGASGVMQTCPAAPSNMRCAGAQGRARAHLAPVVGGSAR